LKKPEFPYKDTIIPQVKIHYWLCNVQNDRIRNCSIYENRIIWDDQK